jgi:hypothetical protein
MNVDCLIPLTEIKMPDFLEANLRVLHRLNAPIIQWLAAQKVDLKDLNNHLVTNQRGGLDWRLPSGQGIFDAIAPQAAYRDWIPQEKAHTSATVIVGCNLGYGIHHVLANTPDSHKILVLEPRPEMVLACLAQTEYGPFLETKRLFFIPPDHQLLRDIAWHLALQYVFGSIFVRSDMPSRQLGPEYAKWTDHCEGIFEDLGCLITTIRTHQDLMVGNELRNFARAIEEGSLISLKDQGQGLSAVVLGAGPSLADFAPLMAGNPGNALYACGLQTLPALQEHGLKPHVCMAVDPTTSLKRVYDRLDMEWAKDIPLIYSRAADPEILRAYPGPTHPVWTFGGIGTNMPRDRELMIDGGGNVGVALTRFLVWCGVDQIILAGQDFAFRGERTHVAGHLVYNNTFHFVPGRHVELKNRDGQAIYSSLSYVTPLRALENDLKRWNTPVFNLYGGGAIIKGSTEVTWEQVIAKGLLDSVPGRLQQFLSALNQARSPRPWPVFEVRSDQWASSLRSVQKRLEGLFRRANKNQEEIHTILEQILVFFRQDPLYQPYLFKEIFSLAGLAHATCTYGRKELTQCRRITERAVKKVQDVDLYLVHNRKAA